jgi:hypothetical protein
MAGMDAVLEPQRSENSSRIALPFGRELVILVDDELPGGGGINCVRKLPLKIEWGIRAHFFVNLRGWKLLQAIPFGLQFVCQIEQHTTKRRREQTRFHL